MYSGAKGSLSHGICDPGCPEGQTPDSDPETLIDPLPTCSLDIWQPRFIVRKKIASEGSIIGGRIS
jgi:hypothetical protein